MKIKTICVTLSEAEMNDFRKVAEAKSISMSVLARRIIRDWLKSPEVQAKLAKEERRISRDWLRSPEVQAQLAKDVEERFLTEKWI
ncbi:MULTISPECIES: hypothetical protein [Sutterella]|uniref:hypothetical protein n=1 Tax=Sutterella TaxID=40544 RepID=UPI0020492990|nr:hypothetical protein [Sutterella sp.]MDR3927727.1 hypothetical protein [Sutterella sp.]DAG84362.1 MAG TPA: Proline dehydrogenase/DNA Complex, Proline, Utilization, DNA, DNA [Caudoviricetes sp.]